MKVNKKNIYLILSILWMGIIFYFSSCSGELSSTQSGNIVNLIRSIFNISEDSFIGSNLSLIIRKLAHISEYFILCIFVSNYLKCFNISTNKVIIYSFIICYLYACTDEIHQMFSEEREPSFIDTLIDSIGIIIWIIIIKVKGIKK